MATVISPSNYTHLTDNFADIRATVNKAKPYLYDAVNTIVRLNDFEPTLDLLQVFYDVYISQNAALASNAPYLAVARALNNHVIRRGNYTSLDAYLDDNNITVDPNWQDISEDAGYTISDTYVL